MSRKARRRPSWKKRTLSGPLKSLRSVARDLASALGDPRAKAELDKWVKDLSA